MFGPASILSLGSTLQGTGGTYSQLAGASSIVQFDFAGIFALQQSAAFAPQSQQFSGAEAKMLDDAFSLMKDGRNDEAEAVLDDILARNGQNGAAIHAKGLIESFRGEHGEAERFFRRADFLAPGRGYGEDAEDARTLSGDDETVFERATAFVASAGTRRRGIGLLLNLNERSPRNADTRILLAESFLADNDIFNGLAHLDGAIRVSDTTQLHRIETTLTNLVDAMPGAPQFQRYLGRVQMKLGQYEQALVTLDAAAKLAGSDALTRTDTALAHVGIGREALAKGNISRALISFGRAKELDPSNFNVREAMAEGYLARADQSSRMSAIANAIKFYGKAARELGKSGPESLRTRIAGGAYAAGRRLEAQHVAADEDLDDETVAFQAAYDLDPDNLTYKKKLAETRNTVGDQYVADEEYDRAAGSYRRAHELYTNDETYKDNLINAYRLSGDEHAAQYEFTDAILVYKKAYDVDRDDETSKNKLAEASNTRGLDYQEKNKFTEAVADFKEALRLFPDNATYQANYDALEGYDPYRA